MDVNVTMDPNVENLGVGLVVARGVHVLASDPELRAYARQVVQRVGMQGAEGGDVRRVSVRELIRTGGFRPAGRNKPAQEYLLRAAGELESWPMICNAVDVLNVISLASGLPISLLSLDRMGKNFRIRYGLNCEQYVFNRSGQVLDVEGLICLCRDDAGRTTPVASPVKDSQSAKVIDQDQHLLACLYAPRSCVDAAVLDNWAHSLGDGLSRWCAGQIDRVWLEPETW